MTTRDDDSVSEAASSLQTADDKIAHRNAQRRARYAANEDLRQRARDRARNLYASNRGDDFGDDIRIIEANIAIMPSMASERLLRLGNHVLGPRLSITQKQMAHIICRNAQVLQRMNADGRWPRPLCRARGERSPVYLLEEAEALAKIFLEQIRTRLNYSHRHTETRDALFLAVFQAREAAVTAMSS